MNSRQILDHDAVSQFLILTSQIKRAELTEKTTRSFQVLVLICSLLLLTSEATAGVIRDDVADQLYRDFGNSIPAAVWLDSGCSGTLVAPDWVLTSAHCVDAIPQSSFPWFRTGNGPDDTTGLLNVGIRSVHVANGWDDNGRTEGNDIALLQLSNPISSVMPLGRSNASVSSVVGKAMYFAGYGDTGNGMIGEQDGTAGTKRGVQNMIDARAPQTAVFSSPFTPTIFYPQGSQSYHPNVLLTDFDGANDGFTYWGGSSNPLPLEGESGSGDSGAGWIVDGNVAAVNMASGPGTYGSYNLGIAVQPFNDWINSVMGGVNWNRRTTVGATSFHDPTAWGDSQVPGVEDVRFSLPAVSPFLFGSAAIRLEQSAVVNNLWVENGPHEFFNGGWTLRAKNTRIIDGGSMNVSGDLTSDEFMLIGEQGHGTFMLESGTVLAPRIDVGSHVSGEYTQDSGATLYTDNLLIGVNSGSSGDFKLVNGSVSGSDTGSLVVGNAGFGTLTQTGGVIKQTSLMTVGNGPTAQGVYTLSGGSADVARLIVGDRGRGQVTQQAGSSLEVNGEFTIGATSTEDNRYALTGGSLTLNGNGSYFVGRSGTGTLTLSDGVATVNDGSLYVGDQENSDGTLTIGEGILAITNENKGLHIGARGDGQLNLTGVSPQIVAPTITLGGNATGIGEANIEGGTITVEHDLGIGGAGEGGWFQSGGTLHVGGKIGLGLQFDSNGGMLISGSGGIDASELLVGGAGNSLVVFNGGASHIHGETVLAQLPSSGGEIAITGGTFSSREISFGSGEPNFIFDSGSLQFERFGDSLSTLGIGDNGEGILTIGDRYPQATVEGDYLQGGRATLEVGFAASEASTHTALTVEGDAELDGTLRVLLLDGYEAQLNDVFSLIETSGIISGTFSDYELPSLSSFLKWSGWGTFDTLALAVIPSLSGDYNGDGQVGAADYTIWRDNFGQAVVPGTIADGNSNGIVDAADYSLWRDNYGLALGSGSADLGVQIPEPMAAQLVILVVAIACSAASIRSPRQQLANPQQPISGT